LYSLLYRYVDDLATIYHPERMSMLSLIAGLSLTIDSFGGEVPFFYLSGKYNHNMPYHKYQINLNAKYFNK